MARGELDLLAHIVCGGLTIALSWLTYRIIERGYQKRRYDKGSWRDAVKTVILPTLILAAICIGIIASKGLAFRVNEDLADILRKFEARNETFFTDRLVNNIGLQDFTRDAVSVVVMGDSFAGGTFSIIKDLPRLQVYFGGATDANCRAIIIPKRPEFTERCEKNWESLEQDFFKADVILIVESHASHGFFDASDQMGYEKVIGFLRDRGFEGRIILSGVRPIFKSAPYQMAFNAGTVDDLNSIAFDNLVLTPEEMNAISGRMKTWARENKVLLLPIFPSLCDLESCAVVNEAREIIYIDRTHFNEAAKPLLQSLYLDALIQGVARKTAIGDMVETLDFSAMSDAEIAAIDNKYDSIALALLREDGVGASRIVDMLIATTTPKEVSAILRKGFNQSGDITNRNATLLLAERLLNVREDRSARYLLGLAYYRGLRRPKENAKVIQYWDHPSMIQNGRPKYILSEIFADINYPFHDQQKARAALEASRVANYKPED